MVEEASQPAAPRCHIFPVAKTGELCNLALVSAPIS